MVKSKKIRLLVGDGVVKSKALTMANSWPVDTRPSLVANAAADLVRVTDERVAKHEATPHPDEAASLPPPSSSKATATAKKRTALKTRPTSRTRTESKTRPAKGAVDERADTAATPQVVDNSAPVSVVAAADERADSSQPTCDMCGYSCSRKYDMKRHIEHVHMSAFDDDFKLTCGVCWRSFASKSSLRRHVANAHFDPNARPPPPREVARLRRRRCERGYCCDVCGRGYESQRLMLAHRDVYHPLAAPMRWSTFLVSRGKLRRCAKCGRHYRDGRLSERHECAPDGEDGFERDLRQRVDELLRAKPRFRCDVCSLCLAWKWTLRLHREVAHPQAEARNWAEVAAVDVPRLCAVCSTAFDGDADLAAHQCQPKPLETQPRPHVCDVCGGRYLRHSDYRRHRRQKHGIFGASGGGDDETDNAAAAAAAAEFDRRKGLIKCPYCDNVAMANRTLILAHIKEVHDIETDSPFVCVACNKVFKRKATLDTHNHTYHPQGENAAENERVLRENVILLNGEETYHCSACNRNFANAIRFLAHHRLHFVERKFTCDLCGKQTRTQHQLNTHIKIIHLNIRNFVCDICRKSFHSRQSCEEHRRIHTGERPFSCEICGKTFIAMNALFTHKKFHDDFYPHACHLCPKKFKVRRSLTNHVRTHTGERPYQCELCSKTFNNSSRFSYHKKVTHSDNRPYSCSLCGSCFKANKFLMRHMKLHNTRTHIQFRRRNNPAYFAEQQSGSEKQPRGVATPSDATGDSSSGARDEGGKDAKPPQQVVAGKNENGEEPQMKTEYDLEPLRFAERSHPALGDIGEGFVVTAAQTPTAAAAAMTTSIQRNFYASTSGSKSGSGGHIPCV